MISKWWATYTDSQIPDPKQMAKRDLRLAEIDLLRVEMDLEHCMAQRAQFKARIARLKRFLKEWREQEEPEATAKIYNVASRAYKKSSK